MVDKNVTMNSFLEINLIRELEKQPQLSQRQLSKRCHVSLGSIHYCLSALIEKGFIKAINFKNSKNKLAYSYILTPTGIAHKKKITMEFLKRKQLEFELIKTEIDELEGELNQMNQKT
tara:strand:- start:85 stop:438 length:354 start_codon:yes stop_codon:yes gene_type:complete